MEQGYHGGSKPTFTHAIEAVQRSADGPPPSRHPTRKLSLSSTPSSAALMAHPTPGKPLNHSS